MRAATGVVTKMVRERATSVSERRVPERRVRTLLHRGTTPTTIRSRAACDTRALRSKKEEHDVSGKLEDWDQIGAGVCRRSDHGSLHHRARRVAPGIAACFH